MIDEATESVVVTQYGSPEERAKVRDLVERLRRGAPDARDILRRLQPFLVSVYAGQAERYRREGLIEPISESLGEWRGGYDSVRGLSVEGMDPDQLIA